MNEAFLQAEVVAFLIARLGGRVGERAGKPIKEERKE